LPVMAVSSLPDAVSAFATGAGLLTLSVKPCWAEPPRPSLAVTTTVKTPPLAACEAPAVRVPEITPVLALMLKPGGRPAAL
jgi:hypothetical protein